MSGYVCNFIRHLRSILGLLVSLGALPVLAETAAISSVPSPLVPWRAEYRATLDGGGPIRASAVRELVPLSDGTWLYRFQVDSLFVDLEESSLIQWRDNQVVPYQYEYLRSSWFHKRQAWLEFNWARLQVLNNVQNQPWLMPIVDGTQDKLSYQLQIQMDLLAGKERLSYQVADGGHLKQVDFQVRGEEVLKTRLGPLTTLYVDTVQDNDDERAARLWFAKDWYYLPVRMILKEPDGRRYEVNLIRARINGRTLE